MPEAVLIVDDDPSIRGHLRTFLERKDMRVEEAPTGNDALKLMKTAAVDVVLLDLRLPDMDGIAVLKAARGVQPETPVVMMTAFADVDVAVRAMKEGADHFVSKPLDMSDLYATIRHLIDSKSNKARVDYLQNKVSMMEGIASYEKIRLPANIKDTIKKLAENVHAPALILGETGTGKTLVANLIHNMSERADHQFVDINCASLPEQLLESELFGYEKGAFTDAREPKMGLLEVANRGTVFFDEVGEITRPVQAKLLSVMETKSFRRLGGTRNKNVDVRVVAATNQDLHEMVEKKKFRQDLYYRLNVIPIFLPPLRERTDDILPLAKNFIEEIGARYKKKLAGLSPNAEKMLLSYSWPGNIRELKNVIERTVLISEEEMVCEKHLPKSLAAPGALAPPSPDEFVSLDEMEKTYIDQVLEAHGRNRTKAAEVLGIHRHTLINKIKKYGLE